MSINQYAKNTLSQEYVFMVISYDDYVAWISELENSLSVNKWKANLNSEPRAVISLKATYEVELSWNEWQGGEDTGRCMTSSDQLEHFRSADKQTV